MKYICTNCGFSTNGERKYTNHKNKCKTKDNITLKICNNCGYSCKKVINYLSHISKCKTIDVDVKMCNKCGFSCKRIRNYINHVKKCRNIDNVSLKVCRKCGFYCKKSYRYITHIKECNKDGTNLNMNCSRCNQTFKKIPYFLKHFKSCVPYDNVTKKICKGCDYVCRKKYHYLEHLRKCNKVKKTIYNYLRMDNYYKCNKCGSKFRKLHYFKRHHDKCKFNVDELISRKINNEKINSENKNIKLYASVTSIPGREYYLVKAIDSLLKQKISLDKIYITICDSYVRFPNEQFNVKVLNKYKNNNIIEINTNSPDFGPSTKLFGSYNKIMRLSHNTKFIILIDDDSIYDELFIFNFYEKLKKSYVKNAYCGDCYFYKTMFMGQGYSGFAVNIDVFNKYELYYSYFVKKYPLVFYHDDFIMSSFLKLKQMNIKKIENNKNIITYGSNIKALKFLKGEKEKNYLLNNLYNLFMESYSKGELNQFI